MSFSELRTKIFLWIGLPAIAVMGLLFGLQDIGPAWQAKSGGGTPGSFVVMREDCGRRSCTVYGIWTATDGSRSRADVILYDEPDGIRFGDKVQALDTGGRKGVFATAGGYNYLLVTAFVIAGVAAAVGWVFFLVRFFRRKFGKTVAAPAAEGPITTSV